MWPTRLRVDEPPPPCRRSGTWVFRGNGAHVRGYLGGQFVAIRRRGALRFRQLPLAEYVGQAGDLVRRLGANRLQGHAGLRGDPRVMLSRTHVLACL